MVFKLVAEQIKNIVAILLSNEIVGFHSHSNKLKDVGVHGNRWCHSRFKFRWNWHYQGSFFAFLVGNWRSIFFFVWRKSSTMSTCATKMKIEKSLNMSFSANWSQFQETFMSSQRLIEISKFGKQHLRWWWFQN